MSTTYLVSGTSSGNCCCPTTSGAIPPASCCCSGVYTSGQPLPSPLYLTFGGSGTFISCIVGTYQLNYIGHDDALGNTVWTICTENVCSSGDACNPFPTCGATTCSGEQIWFECALSTCDFHLGWAPCPKASGAAYSPIVNFNSGQCSPFEWYGAQTGVNLSIICPALFFFTGETLTYSVTQ